MVMPLRDCIARPSEGDKHYPLTEHLCSVAHGVGDYQGSYSERLAFLAGLLHDAGKARRSWQQYIRKPKQDEKVPHAIVGGILFAYLAEQLSDTWKGLSLELSQALEWQRVLWIRDIMDHHTNLKDIGECLPWEGTSFTNIFQGFDFDGLLSFVQGYYLELQAIKLDLATLESWNKKYRGNWRKAGRYWARINRGLSEGQLFQQSIRKNTAQLIQSDRFHAAQIKGSFLSKELCDHGLHNLKHYIQRKVEETPERVKLAAKRQELQDEAVKRYLDSKEQFFLLSLPTGMGKTLTSLKVALLACSTQQQKRIIYVAPYLSILSQAAQDIINATGLEVMQHHSLIWTSQEREWDEKLVLTVEAWQYPIIATSFNQFFRAIFPERAQHIMRLPGLEKAIILIDEPQIINQKRWLLFLRMLEAAAIIFDAQVIFISATPPPLERMTQPVIRLAPDEIVFASRYQVRKLDGDIFKQDIASIMVQEMKKGKSMGVILNTIRDSSLVFQEIVKSMPDKKQFLVHVNGLMTPIHKRTKIEQIHTIQVNKKPMVAVSTQVLEAGLDLSFDAIYRALPIYPSLVQAAGRINRHGEKGCGLLYFFSFARKEGQKTRHYVYRERKVREITDELLKNQTQWDEWQFTKGTQHYFNRLIDEMSFDYLQAVREAAQGKWSSLAGIAPFDDEYSRISVFVPWGENNLPSYIESKLERWCIIDLEELYSRYLDLEWVSSLNFIERKQFLGILQQFIVLMPGNLVPKVIRSWKPEVAIQQATGLDSYSNESGFASLYEEDKGADIL